MYFFGCCQGRCMLFFLNMYVDISISYGKTSGSTECCSFLMISKGRNLKMSFLYFLGSGPDRGQSPVEWGDFP